MSRDAGIWNDDPRRPEDVKVSSKHNNNLNMGIARHPRLTCICHCDLLRKLYYGNGSGDQSVVGEIPGSAAVITREVQALL